MRFAYADPPYVGQAKRNYGEGATPRRGLVADPAASEVDHAALIAQLQLEYPDGWALSASSPSLHVLMPLLPPAVRIAAWVKPFAVFKPGVNPAYTWEPVFFTGGRKRDRTQPTVKDHLSCSITLRKGLVGVKPDSFCQWIIALLGAEPGDTFDDLFPGSGAFGRVWEECSSYPHPTKTCGKPCG